MNRYKIADYDITDKGQDFINGLGPSQDLSSIVETLFDVSSQFKPRHFKDLDRHLPILEGRGLIARVDSSLETLIPSISDEARRRAVSVYADVARELPVREQDLSRLHRQIRSRLESYARDLREEGGGDSRFEEPGSSFAVALKLAREARTRSDRVIALDAAMSLEHDAGGVVNLGLLPEGLGPGTEEDLEDENRVSRIRNKLADY